MPVQLRLPTVAACRRGLRGLLGAAALGCLLCLTGCYSEFLGPAPGSIHLVADQPGGSYRLPSVNRTEYTVHLFWGIWTPKKTNSWKTLEAEVKGRQADGIYNLRIDTYMPWWHIFPAWLTGGIVDISGHTIQADTYAFAAQQGPATPPPAAPATPTPPAPPPPQAAPPNNPDVTPTQKPPEAPLIEGDPDRPDRPAPMPGRDPAHPGAPPPVAGPQ